MDAAGAMAALGINPERFLITDDPTERAAWIAIARRAAVHRDRMDENLAVQIANAVGRLFRR